MKYFDKNMIWPHGHCCHFALSTLLETWLKEPVVLDKCSKTMISPKIPKYPNVIFDTKNKIISILDIIWYSSTHFNMCLENGFFKAGFQQSAKGKTTALTVRSYHVLSKSSVYDSICYQHSDFQAPTPFVFPTSN